MKKLLLTFLLVLTIPLSAFAISLDELQLNSNKYVNVHESKRSSSYVDIDSIQAIRYAPPYYTMKARCYIVDYNYTRIVHSTLMINYDYNRTLESLASKFKSDYPTMPTYQLTILVVKEMEKNSGITLSNIETKMYDFDGSFIRNAKDSYNNQIPLTSAFGRIANYVFYKGYNTYFFDPSLIKR